MISARIAAQNRAGLERRLVARAGRLGEARVRALVHARQRGGQPWRSAAALWPGFGRPAFGRELS